MLRAAVCRISLVLLVSGSALLLGAARPQAQEGCPAPPSLPTQSGANIFSEQQEMWLGDIIAEQMQRRFRLASDPDVTDHLARIAARLLRHMPPTQIKFRFYLFDSPVAQAYTAPGGRIYVSRKLAAMAKSEDEVAGVLAHELGHAVTHQSARTLSEDFRRVLGVTKVGDRQDILKTYQRLLESWRRNPKALRGQSQDGERNQLVADRLGLEALAAAGYAPQSFAEIFDRIAETQGKTGNWLTDFFGQTRPEAKRLREMQHTVASLPPGCIETAAKGDDKEFRDWRRLVIAFDHWEHSEVLHAVLSKVRLDPPIQDDLTQIQFSPDGRYILAQDSGTIYILNRISWSLSRRLTIPAYEAYPARFTPDSKSVVFAGRDLRVERWDVETGQRTDVDEVLVQKGCADVVLAPDARTLACLGSDAALRLVDVERGEELLHVDSFWQPLLHFSSTPQSMAEVLLYIIRGIVGPVHVEFSPDGRYFVGLTREKNVAFDTRQGTRLKLGGTLGANITGGFAFLSLDQVAARPESSKETSLVRFPTGQVQSRLKIFPGDLSGAAHGAYIQVRPPNGAGTVVYNLQSGQEVMRTRVLVQDLYDDIAAQQAPNGEMAIYRVKDGTPIAGVVLQGGQVGDLRVMEASSDLKWLAASGHDRGAVWSLQNGKRLFLLHAFRGVDFAPDGAVYAEFLKPVQGERDIVRIDLQKPDVHKAFALPDDLAHQMGPFLIDPRPQGKGFDMLARKVTWEIRDAATGNVLWSRQFPKETPRMALGSSGESIVLAWDATSDAVEEELKRFPQFLPQAGSGKRAQGDLFVEILNARDGSPRAGLLVRTGNQSFRVSGMLATPDQLVLTDKDQNRIVLYDLRMGKEQGSFFGNTPDVSPAARLLAAENENDHLYLYDLSSLEERDQFVFSCPILLKRFSLDGKNLLIVTADQNVYQLDISDDAVLPSAQSPHPASADSTSPNN